MRAMLSTYFSLNLEEKQILLFDVSLNKGFMFELSYLL